MMAKLKVLLPAALCVTLLLHAASVHAASVGAESFCESGLGGLADDKGGGITGATGRKLSLGECSAGPTAGATDPSPAGAPDPSPAGAPDPSNPTPAPPGAPASGDADRAGVGVAGLSHSGHGTEIEYDYVNDNNKGPASWGMIKPEWAICGTGKMQSPIDLKVKGKVDVPKSETVTKHYKPCTYTMLVNRATSIELQWVDGGNVNISGKEYNLTNVHAHSPSEHTINGKRYDLELHAVHADNEQPKNFAVISMLYKIGNTPDPFLAMLEGNISTFVKKTAVKEIEMGTLDPNDIGITGNEFYRYQGSLTVPPCSETVVWTVEEQIKTVTADQVNLVRDAVHDSSRMNARPVQQLNGRNVCLYVDPQITARN